MVFEGKGLSKQGGTNKEGQMNEKTSGTIAGKHEANIPQLPAKGTVNKNVYPYKIGRGTINKIIEFINEGRTLKIEGTDTRTDLGPDPVTLFIFTAGNGERYGVKAEDVEFPN